MEPIRQRSSVRQSEISSSGGRFNAPRRRRAPRSDGRVVRRSPPSLSTAYSVQGQALSALSDVGSAAAVRAGRKLTSRRHCEARIGVQWDSTPADGQGRFDT